MSEPRARARHGRPPKATGILAPWRVAQCPGIWAALTDYVNAGRELSGDDGDSYKKAITRATPIQGCRAHRRHLRLHVRPQELHPRRTHRSGRRLW